MFRTTFITFLIVVIGLLATACGDSKKTEKKTDDAKDETAEKLPVGLTPEQAAKVVAKVGDSTITVGDVTEQINRLSPYIRRRWATPEKRKEFLQKLIRIELLSQEAMAQGLDNDPEVQRTVKQVMIRLMVKNDLQKEFLPTSVDEKLLKEEYEKQTDKFHRPPQIRISQIVVADQAAAQKLIKELNENAEDRKFFRDKAKELSLDEETKNRGGDVGYFSDPALGKTDELNIPVEVAKAAWELKETGDLAQTPIKSDKGYHIIKLTNKKPEMNRSFESVKRLLENRLLRELRREKMDEFVNKLKESAKIEIFEDNLAKLKIEVSEDELKPLVPKNVTPKDENTGADVKADAPK